MPHNNPLPHYAYDLSPNSVLIHIYIYLYYYLPLHSNLTTILLLLYLCACGWVLQPWFCALYCITTTFALLVGSYLCMCVTCLFLRFFLFLTSYYRFIPLPLNPCTVYIALLVYLVLLPVFFCSLPTCVPHPSSFRHTLLQPYPSPPHPYMGPS